jgi:4-hydroxythreonine-4-phosphate dehydrogenase
MPVKPVLAITLGDPAGIGPEIVCGAFAEGLRVGRPVVFGHWPTLEDAIRRTGANATVRVFDEATPPAPGEIAVVPTGPGCEAIVEPGAAAARAQVLCLRRALDAVLHGPCDALITAPMNKALAATIEPSFTGHTEYLASGCGLSRDDVTMIFVRERLAVSLVTTHVPLAAVPATITAARYERTIRHLLEALAAIDLARAPRIALAALNPHAGEDGRFGREELEIMEPIRRSLGPALGIDLVGPIPADAVFRDALAGHYDGVVAAYHDQAMIPLKIAGPGGSVNATFGLPFARTSPDHGVAYDIARRGRADPGGMIRALYFAARLWKKQKGTV